MEWYTILILIFGCISAIGPAILIIQLFPLNPRLSFTGMKAFCFKSLQSKEILEINVGIKNKSKRDALFDLNAKLKIEVENGNFKTEDTTSPKKSIQYTSKETSWDYLHFDFHSDFQDWKNPKVKFIYSYLKNGKTITKKTRWIKVTKY